LAAASYLSIGDILSAELLLLKCGETTTAFLIDTITQVKNPRVRQKFVMLAIQSGLQDEVFTILDDEEKLRFATTLSFNSDNDREQFYQRIGLKTIAEYAQMVADAEPFWKLQYLLLTGDFVEAANAYLAFARDRFHPQFIEVSEMAALMELADLCRLEKPLLVQIVCLSLCVAAYRALWKGYNLVINTLKDRIVELRSSLGVDTWLLPLLEEAIRALELFGKPENQTRIYAAGHSFLNLEVFGTAVPHDRKYGRLYTMENGSYLPMEVALMWFDLTSYSPVSLTSRHYVL
jgi:hypothetical protein